MTIPSTLLANKAFSCVVTMSSLASLAFFCSFDSTDKLSITYYQSQEDLSGKEIRICLNGVSNPGSNALTTSFVLLSKEYISSKGVMANIDSSNSGITY